MLIGRRYAGMSLRQIGEAIGELSYPAVSDAVRRTTGRLEKDRSLQKRLKRVIHCLNLLRACCPIRSCTPRTQRSQRLKRQTEFPTVETACK
jgi:hypothetical protein